MATPVQEFQRTHDRILNKATYGPNGKERHDPSKLKIGLAASLLDKWNHTFDYAPDSEEMKKRKLWAAQPWPIWKYIGYLYPFNCDEESPTFMLPKFDPCQEEQYHDLDKRAEIVDNAF